MSEHHAEATVDHEPAVDAAADLAAEAPTEAPAETPTVPPTGHAGVDDVLDSLAGLDDQPVDDHVAVFERAHDDLRRALSDAGEQD